MRNNITEFIETIQQPSLNLFVLPKEIRQNPPFFRGSIAEGRYALEDNLLSLKSEGSKNLFKDGSACPKTIPPEVATGYGYVDSGDYTITKCNGKAALTRGPKGYNHFVLLNKSP